MRLSCGFGAGAAAGDAGRDAHRRATQIHDRGRCFGAAYKFIDRLMAMADFETFVGMMESAALAQRACEGRAGAEGREGRAECKERETRSVEGK